MTLDTVTVLGGGRMAAAYADVLRLQGWPVSQEPGPLVGTVVLACFSGKQSQELLAQAAIAPGTMLMDLTTQSVPDARICRSLATKAGATYLAGGVTGGVREVGSPSFSVLLGGLAAERSIPPCVEPLGKVIRFDTVEQAVSAKLLHNFVLIATNHALGIALWLADKAGVSDLVAVLEAGTAGRAVRCSSAVRDHAEGACSSYTSELVAKDLLAMLSSFPELQDVRGIDLEQLAAHHAAHGCQAYTSCSLLAS